VYKGKNKFVNPLTLVIQDDPSVIPCSRVTPVMWKIEDHWYCCYPTPAKCVEPMQVHPFPSLDLQLTNFTDGLGKIIYTESMLAQHLEYIRTKNTHRSVSNRHAMAAIENSNEDGTIGSSIGRVDIREIENTLGPKLIPFYGHLGSTVATIIEIFIILIITIACALFAYYLVMKIKHPGSQGILITVIIVGVAL
jgi:hypothetical protein